MRIFHIASAADWAAAQLSGSYTTSTRGRSLAEEGFLHACRGDQWQGVRERYYADVDEPLVLLVIETDLLTSPVVEEVPAGADASYPHIYGPLDPAAVVQVIDLGDAATPSVPTPTGTTTAPAAAPTVTGTEAPAQAPSFSRLFLGEMFHNLRSAIVLLVAVVLGAGLGEATETDWGPLIGTLIGFVVGLLVARVVHRQRS